jgi:hypothetical protein
MSFWQGAPLSQVTISALSGCNTIYTHRQEEKF